MTTIRQAAANRLNSLKSTGPTSSEGKSRARRNSLKHGLSGYGIVLPDETQAQIEKQILAFRGSFQETDALDRAMLQQAAVEHIRILDCQRIGRELRTKQSLRAETHWEIDRRDEARILLGKLARNPLVYAGQLESTIQGCDLMVERWEQLLTLLETGKPWADHDRSQALDLLAVAKDFRKARSRVDARPGESKTGVQKQVADSEIERLKRLKDDLLIGDDEDDREETLIGLGIINQPTHLIRRYEAICQKRFQVAIQWLECKRTPPDNPAPKPEPRREKKTDRDRAGLESDPLDLDSPAAIDAFLVKFGFPPIKLAATAPLKAIVPPQNAASATPIPTPATAREKRRKGVRDKRGR